MVGTSLLISPVVLEGMTTTQAYFPQGTSKTMWYDWFTGVFVSNGNENITLSAPLNFTNIHILGGSIVPFHPQPLNNTQLTRLTPYALKVALDYEGNAEGCLYVDDGESITVEDAFTLVNFTASTQVLTSVIINAGKLIFLFITYIYFYFICIFIYFIYLGFLSCNLLFSLVLTTGTLFSPTFPLFLSLHSHQLQILSVFYGLLFISFILNNFYYLIPFYGPSQSGIKL